MQSKKGKGFGTSFDLGPAASAQKRLAVEECSAARHDLCPTSEFSHALLKSAATRRCTPGELLVARLAEMQRRIVGALGEISYAQFYDPEPQGFMLMRRSDGGFNITVDFHPTLVLTAIYHEPLISLHDLEQRKERWLAAIRASAPSLGKKALEERLIVQLKTGGVHWNGRMKVALALEILSAECMAATALSFSETDNELELIPFTESPVRLQQLALRMLGTLYQPGPPA